MQASVGSEIVIRNYTKSFFDEVRQKLEFPNPDYYKKQALGKYVGNIQKDVVLWQRHGSDLVLPFGMLKFCFDRANQFDEGILNAISMPKFRFDYRSNINLYDYQEKAVLAALRNRNGIIVAPCGSGKTQIALEIAARLGQRMLWITHTIDLMNQSIERAKSVYGLSKDDYGTITGGKIDLGKVVTFATVQTLANVDLSTSLMKNYWQVVIVDECHKAVGTPTKLMMFWKVVSSLSARYKFGLTATPKRADGLEPCMYALLGEKVYEVPKEAVEDTTCPVEVVFRETNFNPPFETFLAPDGTIDHNELMSGIICDAGRNAMICEDVKECEKPCMILTDRVAHAEFFKWAFGDDAILLVGSQSKKEREEGLERFRRGEVPILVATYPIAKEGLDVPNLRSVFLATPTRNEVTVVQSCGRVGRKADGKEKGIVYDYVDKIGILKRSADQRKKIYKKSNFLFTF